MDPDLPSPDGYVSSEAEVDDTVLGSVVFWDALCYASLHKMQKSRLM